MVIFSTCFSIYNLNMLQDKIFDTSKIKFKINALSLAIFAAMTATAFLVYHHCKAIKKTDILFEKQKEKLIYFLGEEYANIFLENLARTHVKKEQITILEQWIRDYNLIKMCTHFHGSNRRIELIADKTCDAVENKNFNISNRAKEIRSLISKGEVKNLTFLNLFQEKLTEIPIEIQYLTQLTKIDLSDNKLTEILPEIKYLTQLKEINLSHNQLTQIPVEIKSLTQLKEINLSHNQLTQIPSEIGELNQLEQLNISFNQLHKLPIEISKLTLLEYLDVRENKIKEISFSISNLQKLYVLNLSYNQFTHLPKEIGLLKIDWLNISHNQFTRLPKEIGQLKLLRMLAIDHNPLLKLPSEIDKLPNLKALYISTPLPSWKDTIERLEAKRINVEINVD